MIIAGAFFDDLQHVLASIYNGVLNVAFTGSLLLSFLMMGSVYLYSRRRPVGAPLTWGQAMAAAMYVTFIMVWFFGVVPDRWLNYAQGSLAMRSDAILAGPGSTGWLKDLPVVITHIKYSLTREQPQARMEQELAAENDLGVRFVIPQQGSRWHFR